MQQQLLYADEQSQPVLILACKLSPHQQHAHCSPDIGFSLARDQFNVAMHESAR